ncbi:hypothetical protein POM88_033847 [Heracleum sosnowskyi]|uniref:Protein DA1-like domain-containing protein n=1 Tax=Heracleum sosnowskyi TaxID=360622 RepID=A0AAD8MA10_9APIA|nr:hypothetical protein POM88_033847 [Heracleum sosnowskyi]
MEHLFHNTLETRDAIMHSPILSVELLPNCSSPLLSLSPSHVRRLGISGEFVVLVLRLWIDFIISGFEFSLLIAFWVLHFNLDPNKWSCCERLESWNARYISLGDGRSLCLECMESAVMDTGDCQPLYHAIRDYYEGMNMRLDQQIPMLLVERQALNEAIVGEKNGFHHMPETRGLCLSEEQTVASILKRPRIGGHRLVGMRTQPQKLTRRCEVTAILVLYGLPRTS